MTKYITKIPDEMVIQALQIASNYCIQEAPRCNECMFKMKDNICLTRADLPERFKEWKIERGVE